MVFKRRIVVELAGLSGLANRYRACHAQKSRTRHVDERAAVANWRNLVATGHYRHCVARVADHAIYSFDGGLLGKSIATFSSLVASTSLLRANGAKLGRTPCRAASCQIFSVEHDDAVLHLAVYSISATLVCGREYGCCVLVRGLVDEKPARCVNHKKQPAFFMFTLKCRLLLLDFACERL